MFRTVRRIAVVALFAIAACSRNKPGAQEELEPRPDPIPVNVHNENYLDMNVFVVVSGVRRRLGTVSGNGTTKFTIPWSAANGQTFSLTALPIGGSGQATSGALNVGIGQVVDFKIASVLRQSVASVHDPR